jgi:hypothetical protein
MLTMGEKKDWVRLCVQSHHPIDPGNYDGPIHCTAHPQGTACVTALYERIPETTVTADERSSILDGKPMPPKLGPAPGAVEADE